MTDLFLKGFHNGPPKKLPLLCQSLRNLWFQHSTVLVVRLTVFVNPHCPSMPQATRSGTYSHTA